MKTVTLDRAKVRDITASAPGKENPEGQSSAGGSGSVPTRGSGLGGAMSLGGGGRTPMGGRTPVNFGGRTPMPGNRTPMAGGSYGSSTPSHPGYFGGQGNQTPAHDQGYRSGMSAPRTPMHNDAFRPGTPARANDYGAAGTFGARTGNSNPYNTVMPTTPGTPAMGYMPNTPGGVEPATPLMAGMPDTPAADQYSMPQTPLMDPQTPQMEPQTPYGEPVSTPGGGGVIPQTPGGEPMPTTPGPDDVAAAPQSAEEVALQGYKVLVNVVVSLPEMGDRSAVVTDAAFDGSFINVKLLDNGEDAVLNGQRFTPVQPTAEPGQSNYVKVLDGDHAGRVGTLISMEDHEGVLHGTIDFNGDMQVLDMSMAAKYQRPG
eukprot:Plantae.Rhodophyta-Palmaria_palmata.ctg2528.p1 GENE.Plantae.Rhodophyta-Palmaria_palmata.ctg2528~~Plantae.Rhodophyta-Palmaria_palmata.ctg2528.p1  ORF type:complete len:407 (+),score=46.95 Plantae.Rhodophyta-Palmaria_palmata.ctg2528:103-1221(+)